MAVGRIVESHLGTNASCDEYIERLEMFFDANITMEEQKRGVLLGWMEEAYKLTVSLVRRA